VFPVRLGMGQAVSEMARNRLVRWFQVEMTRRLEEIDRRLGPN